MKINNGNLYVDISLSLIGRLFPPELFEMFIDVGHYVRELNAYKPLVDKISTLTVNIKGVLHAERQYAYSVMKNHTD